MTGLASALTQLTLVASGALTGTDAEEALVEAIDLAHELRANSGWAAVQDEEVSAVALTRSLGDILKHQDASLRSRAATLYASLISLHDAPVGTLCEPYAFAAFVHCLKGICLPARREAAEDGTQDAANEPQILASPMALLDDMHSFLSKHSMRGNPEMFGLLLDALVDMTGSAVGPEYPRPGKAGKRGGGAARHQGSASVADLAFSILPLMLDGRHGDIMNTGSLLCSRLVAVLLGIDVGKRGGQDRRGATLTLLTNFLRSKEEARPCLLALMRQLCLRATERADCRQHAVNSIMTLIAMCTSEEVHSFCLFLHRLSRVARNHPRLVAVELAGTLLSTLPEPFAVTGPFKRLTDGSCGAGDELEAPWSALCLSIVVGRSRDKAASVRSKAIACLAECAQTFASRLVEVANSGREDASVAAFVPALCASRHVQVKVEERNADEADEDDTGIDEEAADGNREARPWLAAQTKVSASIPGKVSTDLTWMTQLCHARCRDEKAAVRKAALQLLESVLLLSAAAAAGRTQEGAGRPETGGPTAADVQVLEEATADSLVSVRKTALQVVCNLLECYPHHAALAGVWASCTLPMVRDAESSVQDTVLDRLSTLLLEPVVALAGKGGRGGRAAGGALTQAQQRSEGAVRQRLAAIAHMGRAASSCLGKALTTLAAKKQLRGAQVAAGLEAFLTAANEAAAAEAAANAQEPARNPAAKSQQQRREQRRHNREQREGAWMLLVEVAALDPAAPSWRFLQSCWEELQAHGASGAAAATSSQEGAMLLWVISHAASRFPPADAAALADGLLKAVLGFNLPCAAVAAHLVALHKLTVVEGGQTMVGQPAEWCARVMAAAEEMLSQAMEARGNLSLELATRCQLALFTLGEVVLLREAKPPGGAVIKVQALTHVRGNTAASGAAAARGSLNSLAAAVSAVCGHAWTCLGKICMVDEGLAKKCVPLIVQEMSACPNPAVRINLLMGLSDMVVQFTGLADAYVGRLAAMVRDPHELVRRQALALLANLLLRDFVKWRGALVHRFLLALVDESASVRQLAQYLLSDSLASKAPMLAYNHFIESLFVLNGCSAGLQARGGSGGGSDLASELALHSKIEGNAFHLKGSTPIMRAKRDIIYTALLRRMTTEQRFAASARLVSDVLGGVSDGLLPLSEAEEVLGDALRLLWCKDMKVNPSRFGTGADDDGGADTPATQEDMNKARGKLVGAMMRKHLAESVVPIMVELRYILQAQKHPLLGSLMLCMASLLRDHKSELEDILVADKQLAREIMHDLKHFETLAKQQLSQQEAAMAAVLGNGSGAGPSRQGVPGGHGAAPTSSLGPADGGQQGRMPPPPPVAPGTRARNQSNVLSGVEPGRTPIAAEVLATVSKLRQARPAFTGLKTPGGVPPGAKTPATQLPGPGAGAGVAHHTPLTGLFGGAQRNAAGGTLAGMPSPAPLSTKARAKQQPRIPSATPLAAAGGARTAQVKPGAAAAAGPSRSAADGSEECFVVHLPDPEQQQNRRQKPLVDGAAAAAMQQRVAMEKQPHRTPREILDAAVRAARRAAAAAVTNDEDKPEKKEDAVGSDEQAAAAPPPAVAEARQVQQAAPRQAASVAESDGGVSGRALRCRNGRSPAGKQDGARKRKKKSNEKGTDGHAASEDRPAAKIKVEVISEPANDTAGKRMPNRKSNRRQA